MLLDLNLFIFFDIWTVKAFLQCNIIFYPLVSENVILICFTGTEDWYICVLA